MPAICSATDGANPPHDRRRISVGRRIARIRVLTGTVAADSLNGAQGDDVLVGYGGADVLYGGAGNDILAVGDLDFARLDDRSGFDTLQLDGAGQALDLTAFGNAVIDAVEWVDLAGSGNNALTLAVTDLLALSDETSCLFVAGNAGDQMTMIGAWQNGGPMTVDGTTYTIFSVAGVEAAPYVEDTVTVAMAGSTGVQGRIFDHRGCRHAALDPGAFGSDGSRRPAAVPGAETGVVTIS